MSTSGSKANERMDHFLVDVHSVFMKGGLTELVFILDESGSMRSLEADTIGGFNSMIAEAVECDCLDDIVKSRLKLNYLSFSLKLDLFGKDIMIEI